MPFKQDPTNLDRMIYVKPNYSTSKTELTDEEYEKIMSQWDYWRKKIADGDTSSSPRDWFEGVIEECFGEKK